MTQVLVTGARGFIGRHLCTLLSDNRFNVRGSSRSSPSMKNDAPGIEYVQVDPLETACNWQEALQNASVVIHLAGQARSARKMDRKATDRISRINAEGTRRLAEQAAKTGVTKFVFISSIKVNGDMTLGHPFRVTDKPQPTDPYAESKWLAEQYLQQISESTDMQITVIRPCMVYGPGMTGNLNRLMTFLRLGLPIPVPVTMNQRSMLAVQNLSDLILNCLTHPTEEKLFLAADGVNLSTRELLENIANIMKRPLRALPLPDALIKSLTIIPGIGDPLQSLTGSLQVDITHTRKTLDWLPPMNQKEALEITVQDWMSRLTVALPEP